MDRDALQERFGIIGTSAALHHVIDRVRLVARTDINVLVQGESGVGKELFANAIHELSGRRHGPLVVVNCGAIPEGLIESELFGSEKGAYTGAHERRIGYFEEADRGTMFLDEIGELPAAAQVRLLRVLESGQFSRVGSSTSIKTDARVIAATNRDLGREVEVGRFREDLYYRLSTVVLVVPPLRDRREDILPIFGTFMHRFTQKYNSPGKRLDDGAEQLLLRYHWPGNVRELRNVAEQCVVLGRSEVLQEKDVRPFLRGVGMGARPGDLVRIGSQAAPSESNEREDPRERELIYRALIELRNEMHDLKEKVGAAVAERDGGYRGDGGQRSPAGRTGSELVVVHGKDDDEQFEPLIEDIPYEIENDDPGGKVTPAQADLLANGIAEDDPLPTLQEAERMLIAEALRRFEGNRRQTARTLGISERTLYRKLKEYDLEG